MLYSVELLHYFHNVRHAGTLDTQDPAVLYAEIINEKEGIALALFIRNEHHQITQAKFQATGSPAIIAACEFVCGYLENKDLTQAKQLSTPVIMQALKLSPLQNHTAVLVIRLVNSLLPQSPAGEGGSA
jgi:NifU-like protein involved in Fe-S cluster formation